MSDATFTIIDLSKYFDHTLLKADATPKDITTLVEEAVKYNFKSVCVNSCNVNLVSRLLTENDTANDVICCAVIGFPLGAMATEVISWFIRLIM